MNDAGQPRFTRFAEELRVHTHNGYHVSLGGVARDTARSWFAARAITPHESYLEFLERFGPGRYFAGALQIFALDDTQLGVAGNFDVLEPKAAAKLFLFGYGGVSSDAYALSRSGADASVRLVVEGAAGRKLHADFATWIDAQPRRLFKADSYKCYGPVTRPDEIARIVQERAVFRVRCVAFDRELVGDPAQPRFGTRCNRVRVGVTKLRESPLETLTVRFWRAGSQYGEQNVVYERLAVAGAPVGVETLHEVYSFDCYGRTFERIEVLHEPEIDLSNNQRSQFHEIRDYL